MKKMAILICILLLIGCRGRWINVNPDPVPKKIIDQTYYEKNYKIGEKTTAFVGQEIIRVRSFNEKVAIFSPAKKSARSQESLDIQARYNLSNYHIKSEANKEYKIDMSIQAEGKKFNIIQLNDERGKAWGVLVHDNGIVLNNAIYSSEYKMLFYPLAISMKPVVFKIYQKDREIESTIPGPFYELIYSGKNDVSLNFTYREYTRDDLARPAFFQNLTYQADAKQIRFKDFVIKIEDVSNEKITYTVIEDGLK